MFIRPKKDVFSNESLPNRPASNLPLILWHVSVDHNPEKQRKQISLGWYPCENDKWCDPPGWSKTDNIEIKNGMVLEVNPGSFNGQ